MLKVYANAYQDILKPILDANTHQFNKDVHSSNRHETQQVNAYAQLDLLPSTLEMAAKRLSREAATHSWRSELHREHANLVLPTRDLLLMELDATIQDALKTNSRMRMVTATHAPQEPLEALTIDLASGQTDPCSKPMLPQPLLTT